jgi:hypothetical protein
VSAGVAAGAAALFLERNAGFFGSEARKIISLQAASDAFFPII